MNNKFGYVSPDEDNVQQREGEQDTGSGQPPPGK